MGWLTSFCGYMGGGEGAYNLLALVPRRVQGGREEWGEGRPFREMKGLVSSLSLERRGEEEGGRIKLGQVMVH